MGCTGFQLSTLLGLPQTCPLTAPSQPYLSSSFTSWGVSGQRLFESLSSLYYCIHVLFEHSVCVSVVLSALPVP